jgi:hypothetical protein
MARDRAKMDGDTAKTAKDEAKMKPRWPKRGPGGDKGRVSGVQSGTGGPFWGGAPNHRTKQINVTPQSHSILTLAHYFVTTLCGSRTLDPAGRLIYKIYIVIYIYIYIYTYTCFCYIRVWSAKWRTCCVGALTSHGFNKQRRKVLRFFRGGMHFLMLTKTPSEMRHCP